MSWLRSALERNHIGVRALIILIPIFVGLVITILSILFAGGTANAGLTPIGPPRLAGIVPAAVADYFADHGRFDPWHLVCKDLNVSAVNESETVVCKVTIVNPGGPIIP